MGIKPLTRLGIAMITVAASWLAMAQPVSVTPASGNSSTQNLTFTFNVPGGFSASPALDVLINSALDGRSACYMAFVPSSTSFTLYLVNDGGPPVNHTFR